MVVLEGCPPMPSSKFACIESLCTLCYVAVPPSEADAQYCILKEEMDCSSASPSSCLGVTDICFDHDEFDHDKGQNVQFWGAVSTDFLLSFLQWSFYLFLQASV